MRILYPALAVVGALLVAGVFWHHVSPANRAKGCHTRPAAPAGGPTPQPAKPPVTPGSGAAPTKTSLPAPVQASPAAPGVPAGWRGKIIRHRVRHFPDKLLALTFDDGPSPEITPLVLKALTRSTRPCPFVMPYGGRKSWGRTPVASAIRSAVRATSVPASAGEVREGWR